MSTTSVSITIKGERVQGIGYRPFLLEKAVRLKINNFDAVNIEPEKGDEIQTLIIYISGEDKQISEFTTFIKSEKGRPRKARVDSVMTETYLDDVISIGEYRNILSVEQQSKTVQGGLLLNEKMDIMIGRQDIMIGKQDIMIGKQEETIGEIMNLRSDLKSHFDKRFEILEKDVFLIKKKICIA